MNIEYIIKYFNNRKKRINPEKEPGFSTAIIHNGQVVYELNHGLASLEHEIPLTSNSLYYLASVSKQFTATCVLNLVNDKLLKLGQVIRDIVKETEHFKKKITVQNLLNHTSGIADYFKFFYCQLGRHPSDYFENADILKVISNFYSLEFLPNEKFSYSNSNYIILAQIVKLISGISFPKYAKEIIFTPLGMKNTLFDDDRYKIIKNRVYSYNSNKLRKYSVNLKNSCTVGDGGVLSNINDLVKWEINFHDNKVLPNSIIKRLTNNLKLSNGEYVNYGNGLGLIQEGNYKYNVHSGSFEGFRTYNLRVPSMNLSVIYLSNSPSLVFDFKPINIFKKK